MIPTPDESEFVAFMVAHDKTVEQIAKAAKVTPRAVRFWLSGQREPRLTIPQVKGLCLLFRCSVHRLPDHLGPIKKTEE